MDVLSSSHLNEIGNLYESIAFSEQEVLNEFGINPGGNAALQAKKTEMAKNSAFQSRLDAMRAQRFGGTNPVVKSAKNGVQGTLDKTTGKFTAAARPTAPAARPTVPAAKPAAVRPSAPTSVGSKVIPTAAKPTGSPMQQWAAAHPDLAAKVKPGQSGYGDIQKQRNAASLSAPAAPATSTLGRTVAAASRPQTAFTPRPATTAQATAAAPSTSPAASGSVVPPTNAIAAAPRLKPMVPARTPIAASYEYEDVYDLVFEYLVAEGYADTEESATAIMANMSEEWRESIVEGNITDRPLGYMHRFARGMKQKKGEKREVKYGVDKEGNPTGKYTEMQKSKNDQ
jgi:hypothetical protein